MALPHDFHPRLRRSLEVSRPDGRRSSSLPLALLEDAPRRIRGWCCVLYGLAAAGALSYELAELPVDRSLRYGVLGIALLATLTLHALAAGDRLTRQRLLDLSLLHEVVLAATAAGWTVSLTWCAGERSPILVTPVAGFIALYPLIVPNTLGRTAVAAFAAAGMEPLMAWFVGTTGIAPLPSTAEFLEYGRPNLLAALLAIAIASFVRSWGRRLTQARMLGSYQLLDRIGAGGMGEVWRARHELLARPAAIKLIRAEALQVADKARRERLIERFEREAQAMAALCSPHATRLYDFGLAQDGSLFLAMELLDGLDLNELVERHGPQPPGRVVRWLRQACHALHEAHEAGLVHRDVKPGNLMACRLGLDVDHLKVLDFGLVKSLSVESEIDRGVAVGTPWYMAPEAVLSLEGLDRRSDLYSLACVGYWLLTGEQVFGHETASQEVRAQVLEDPLPPSRKTEHWIPQPLESLLMECLEKDPDDRPADARILSRRLDELGLEKTWTPERAAAWWDDKEGPSETRSASP